jgi:hypothetical protein
VRGFTVENLLKKLAFKAFHTSHFPKEQIPLYNLDTLAAGPGSSTTYYRVRDQGKKMKEVFKRATRPLKAGWDEMEC